MTLKQKLSSRKLWAAVAGIVAGIAMVFGLDESVVNTVAGAVMALASVVTYITTEGKLDAAAVAGAITAAQDARAAITADEGNVTVVGAEEVAVE